VDDGMMVQAIILAAVKFAGILDVTNLSPINGIGSQILPKNLWANPSLWPFAFFDKEFATDISALIALAIFVVGCDDMARCFDVPVVPSAISAQLCILLFAPTLLRLHMPTNFCLTPADAVVYAPYMAALGLFARIEPGSWRGFGLMTGGRCSTAFIATRCSHSLPVSPGRPYVSKSSKGSPKMKLQASEPSPESLQSQTRPWPKKRLSIRRCSQATTCSREICRFANRRRKPHLPRDILE
jgi:hypothetical protein